MDCDTLIEKNEGGRLEEVKYEYRVSSKLKASSGNPGPSRSHRGEQIPLFSSRVYNLMLEALN